MLRLQRELQKAGWSYAEAARRSGVNQVTVGLIVSRRFRPYDSQLVKLARAVGWPTERAAELLEEVDDDA